MWVPPQGYHGAAQARSEDAEYENMKRVCNLHMRQDKEQLPGFVIRGSLINACESNHLCIVHNALMHFIMFNIHLTS